MKASRSSSLLLLDLLGGASHGPRHHLKYLWTGEQQVCREAFLFLHEVSDDRLQRVRETFSDPEIVAVKPHGNAGRLPPNATDMATARGALMFLIRYVEENGMPSPGRDRRLDDGNHHHLPPNTTLREVYDIYRENLPEGMLFVRMCS